MRRPPRSLEEWLFYKLIDSAGFHRFVGRIYRKVNGIKESPYQETLSASQFLYKPTATQKFKAFRILFWDEMRSIVGLPRNAEKYYKHK